ncbi:hypothetical protein CSW98_02440 [Vibrio sp. HA2012]|uniref:tellurite resistance TerB family protein n=1 Tax=Vibrio sp. HA2012 TaxID=1971595 RepID=UPI000C2C2B1D|nr:TerB family tellurite resistance protein [Vibrio sp. HA2012]PJC88306.1 hypothetical protein CSW98_02440 [Vibrio sp. HA2012]
MLNSIKSIFKQLLEGEDPATADHITPDLAMAALLCEVSSADYQVESQEQQAKLSLLQHLLSVEKNEALQLIEQAMEKVRESASLYDFTSRLRELTQETRFELIKAMWSVAYADGHIDPLEDAVIRKVAELLYVDHHEFIRAKLLIIDARKE